jgi:hypothetical protein
MSVLEDLETTDEAAETTFQVDGRRVTVDGAASEAECAALACAVASHLRDEAAARAVDDAEPDRYASPVWKLAARLGARRKCRVPRSCPGGSEWRYSGRTSRW